MPHFFFTFDLKSGYHHVDIHEDCWDLFEMRGYINQCSSWHDSLRLTPDVHLGLLLWQTQTPFLKGQPIWFGAGVARVAFSDANSTGYGGYVVELGPHDMERTQGCVSSFMFLCMTTERACY